MNINPLKHPALVFNCQYNGLATIQELGRHGISVFALDSVRSVGTYSRYARFHHCPDPQVAEDQFIDYLIQLGASFEHKPVLFPTNDHWAVAISRHKERLASWYLPCVADYSTVELLIEKQRFYDWALSQGYPVPRSWRSNNVNKIPDDAFPLAAKPEYRRIASNDLDTDRRAKVLDQMRLTVLRNRQDVANFKDRHQAMLPYFLFQEYVEGLSDCMVTVGVYADRDHRVLGLFSGRKVRGFPPDVGDCIVGQHEAVPDDLKKLVKQMCNDLGFHGIGEFEFKRDAVTGEYKLIEINPRSWSWVGITPACDVSLTWIAYRDMVGLPQLDYAESGGPDGNVKWVRILDDLPNCLYRNHRIGCPQWHMGPRQWRRSLKAERLVVAEFSADDPVPGLFATLMLARGFADRILRR